MRDLGSIPCLGRSPGEGKGYSLQYSGLENSMDCIVPGVTKSRTRLSDFTFTFTFLVAQRVMNPPAMRETWVRSLGWEDPWRGEGLLTPVFWPGEFHGLYSPWGCKELGMPERLSLSLVIVPRVDKEYPVPFPSFLKICTLINILRTIGPLQVHHHFL